ncbi:hypothetical protein NDS46_20535 [Paenibacillus thiaminolyticus]|uniref:hypothetical protein n=1 Tax=Paenibacillus thiaminolyticus TaxID=49283 RepID=UPI00232EF1F0|nr:hypothetical protein [Paenibacillus thiaminolyticus]WCF06719.1 hypothetical protein NDS46_20535 [Paenibacillus thiaminolyticus]
MAICIEFELIEERGTVARYRYGHCMQTLEYELVYKHYAAQGQYIKRGGYYA